MATKYLIVLCLLVAGALAGVPKKSPRIDPNLNWRVVGGSNAPDGAYKHIGSLRYFGSHSCGLSLVSEEWAMTAAHCVAGTSPSYLTVVLGSNKLNTGGVTKKVLQVISHENYDSWRIKNDVAVLKIEKVELTDLIDTIKCVSKVIEGDVPVTLAGWGTTSYPGSIPNDLQHLPLKTTTTEQCDSAHSNSVDDTQICTLTKSGEGACHGDSGGPLMSEEDGENRLCGLVSWGMPCARNYPDVYTRVSAFIDWTNEKCDNCCAV